MRKKILVLDDKIAIAKVLSIYLPVIMIVFGYRMASKE